VLPENAKRMEGLVDQVKLADAELAKVREGAAYAGDPDPYRKPAEPDLDDD
jgi:ribosome-binding factor A